MSQSDEISGLEENQSHIIACLQNHESRITRSEEEIAKMKKHLSNIDHELGYLIRQDVIFAEATTATMLSRKFTNHLHDDDEDQDHIEADQQELAEIRTQEHHRLINLCTRTKSYIKNKKAEITDLLNQDHSLLTDAERREKKIKIKTAIKTVSQQVAMYREYSRDVMKICSHNEIDTATENLNEVLDDSNYISSLFEAYEERSQLMEKNSSAASAHSTMLTKFNPVGLDRFIKYKSFMEEFREFILAKPIPPLIKLRSLHASVEGEALKMIKMYTLGDQLTSAIQVLENTYNKPNLVVAEVYRYIKTLPKLKTLIGEKDIKIAKDQVGTLKISIATLKSMGYGEELLNDSNLHNSFLLVELEAKVPMFVNLQWCAEKTRIQNAGGTANIETFTEFYERLVEMNNDAVYTRARLEEMSKPNDDRDRKDSDKRDKDKGNRRNKSALL